MKNEMQQMERWFLAGALALLAAGPVAAEKLTVPLSDPAKPAEIEVSLVMGSIRVIGAAVQEVTIEAVARDEGEDDSEPAIAGKKARGGMRRIPNTAMGLEAEEDHNKVSISAESWARAVDLKITVPAASSATLSTVNDGDIEIENVDGELDLHNTNGEVHAKDVKGPVSAATVNGDVSVAFKRSAAPAPMAFSTLNGDIDVTLPAEFKADVRLRSDNGEIYADFEIALGATKPDIEEKHEGGRYRLVVAREMTGKINGGGPEIRLQTFNGDLLLRRAKN